MEHQIGSKLEKEYVKAVYCHPAYLTYMQSTSREMPGWMKHKLESTLPGEISITSGMQMTSPLWQKAEEELKSLLMKVKEESESESRSLKSDSLRLCELYSPWNFLGQNTGVGSLSFLQGIFPTQ